MESETRTGSDWLILFCAFAGAATFAFFAIELVLQTISGHGSHAGNIIRIATAIMFLFLGFFFITVGTLYRLSFNEDRSNQFR